MKRNVFLDLSSSDSSSDKRPCVGDHVGEWVGDFKQVTDKL